MFDNPRNRLEWLEDELLDNELEEILYGEGDEEECDEEEYEEEKPRRRRRRTADFNRAVYEDDDDADTPYIRFP